MFAVPRNHRPRLAPLSVRQAYLGALMDCAAAFDEARLVDLSREEAMQVVGYFGDAWHNLPEMLRDYAYPVPPSKGASAVSGAPVVSSGYWDTEGFNSRGLIPFDEAWAASTGVSLMGLVEARLKDPPAEELLAFRGADGEAIGYHLKFLAVHLRRREVLSRPSKAELLACFSDFRRLGMRWAGLPKSPKKLPEALRLAKMTADGFIRDWAAILHLSKDALE